MLPEPQASWLYLLRETLCPCPKQMAVQVNGNETQYLSPGGSAELILAAGNRHRIVLMGEKVRRAFDITLDKGEIGEITFRFNKRLIGDQIFYRAQPWRSQVVVATAPPADLSFSVVQETRAERRLPPIWRSFENGSRRPMPQTVEYQDKWTRSFAIGGGQGWTRGGSLGVNVAWLTIQGQVERTLSKQYQISLQHEQTIGGKGMIEIPPSSRINVEWFVVEQLRRGVVQVADGRQGRYYVPFEVAESAFVLCRYGDGTPIPITSS